MSRVVIILDRRGWRIEADAGVEVYCRDTTSADDTLFLMQPPPVAGASLQGRVGYSGDGSDAEKRIERALSDATGLPPAPRIQRH